VFEIISQLDTPVILQMQPQRNKDAKVTFKVLATWFLSNFVA